MTDGGSHAIQHKSSWHQFVKMPAWAECDLQNSLKVGKAKLTAM